MSSRVPEQTGSPVRGASADVRARSFAPAPDSSAGDRGRTCLRCSTSRSRSGPCPRPMIRSGVRPLPRWRSSDACEGPSSTSSRPTTRLHGPCSTPVEGLQTPWNPDRPPIRQARCRRATASGLSGVTALECVFVASSRQRLCPEGRATPARRDQLFSARQRFARSFSDDVMPADCAVATAWANPTCAT